MNLLIHYWRCVVPAILMVFSISVSAAEFALTVKDTKGNVQPDTVVALVPAQKNNYTDTPTVVIDQINKHFVPGVMAVRVNTQVRFPNSDDIRHHVYSFSPAKKFELRLYHGLSAEPVLFDKPGTVVLGCNIHDSMVGYIFVVDTPYFAVTDAQGLARIGQLPAGNYQLEIYHPRMNNNYPASSVQLTADENKQDTRVLDNLSEAATSKLEDEFSNLF